MELKEFLKIFAIHKKLFLQIIILFVFCGLILFVLQKQTYRAFLTLNITRSASSKQGDYYTYDSFYRLQADERFADTVVRWIESPQVIENIFRGVSANKIFGIINTKKLNPKRLSSQVVSVEFVVSDKKDAEMISKKLLKILNDESAKLNTKQQQDNWFIIIGDKPVVYDNKMSLTFLILVSLFLGFFTGFWAVMIKHYFVGGVRKK